MQALSQVLLTMGKMFVSLQTPLSVLTIIAGVLWIAFALLGNLLKGGNIQQNFNEKKPQILWTFVIIVIAVALFPITKMFIEPFITSFGGDSSALGQSGLK